jgi:hypothetical protein
VLLFLSPGLDPKDAAHCATEQGKHYYDSQRTGACDLPDKTEHLPAYDWLNKIIRQFDITYEQARSTVATLNIGAYKSKTFDDWHMLAALPSSRVTLDWAQDVLFPQAIADEKVVVCLRSAKFWGLKTDTSIGSLFCPNFTRSGIMHRDEIRKQTTDAVKSKLKHHRVISST